MVFMASDFKKHLLPVESPSVQLCVLCPISHMVPKPEPNPVGRGCSAQTTSSSSRSKCLFLPNCPEHYTAQAFNRQMHLSLACLSSWREMFTAKTSAAFKRTAFHPCGVTKAG